MPLARSWYSGVSERGDESTPHPLRTGREFADEVQQRGLVDSHVIRILRRAELQPHRSKYWCFTMETDEQMFQSQVEAVFARLTSNLTTVHD